MTDENLSGALDAVDNGIQQNTEAENQETDTTSQEGENPPAEQEQNADGEQAKKSKPGGWHRKIAKLEREKAELAARLQEQQSAAAPAGEEEPSLDNYDTYEDYIFARAEYTARQTVAKERQKEADDAKKQQLRLREQQRDEQWSEKLDALDDTYHDYSDVVSAAFQKVQLRTDLFEAIQESDVGPQVAYHLAKNPELLEKMNDPNKSVLTLAKEIARIESQLSQKKPAAAPSKLPAPITPIKQGSSGTVDLSTLDTDAYLEHRMKQRR